MGVPGRPVARIAHGGFTLIEMLVALVIAGVLIGMAAFSMGGFERGFRFEADRLAQLMVLARDEALIRGAPVRFEADEERFRFLVLRDRRWQPILDDRELRERLWEQPTRVVVERADGRPSVEFGRDPVDLPFALHIERGGERLSIISSGLGTFEVK
jgi:general secretion pathway protein H